MKWRTKLTELLGCKYPIMQGGLSGLGTWELAAAVCEAGAHGNLTAAVSRTPEKLREDIQRLRKATKEPFAVNITIGMCPHIDEMLEVCIEEDVPSIETAAYKPDEYAERIKKSGITWVHKGATVSFVKHAEKLGADAGVLVGLEGYGFKNIRQLPTMTSIAWAARQLKIPFAAAGGIGDSRTMLATMVAGADGIYMGTAFLTTKECLLPDRIKENIVKAIPDHPDLIFELLAPPTAKDYQEIMGSKDKMPLERWIPALERVMLKHHEWRDVPPMWEQAEKLGEQELFGPRLKGPYSFACAYIDRVVTVKEFIDGLIKGAEEILNNLKEEWALT